MFVIKLQSVTMIKNSTLVKLMRTKIILDEIEKGTHPSIVDFQHKIERWLESISYVSDDIKSDISERSIRRDLKDIRQVMNINIEYSKSSNGYYISEDYNNDAVHEMLDSMQLYFLKQSMSYASEYIQFSTRRATGTEHFFSILKAIRDKRKLSFYYYQYEKQEQTERKVSPLGLKEFKGFWYLIATDDSRAIKTFGLDRITGLQQSMEKASIPADFDMSEYYKHCYGIVRIPNIEVQEIVIKTTPIKASYYKANPLHHSQKIVEETEQYTIFALYMYLTYDLQQELRSHGSTQVEVLQPKGALDEEKYK